MKKTKEKQKLVSKKRLQEIVKAATEVILPPEVSRYKSDVSNYSFDTKIELRTVHRMHHATYKDGLMKLVRKKETNYHKRFTVDLVVPKSQRKSEDQAVDFIVHELLHARQIVSHWLMAEKPGHIMFRGRKYYLKYNVNADGYYWVDAETRKPIDIVPPWETEVSAASEFAAPLTKQTLERAARKKKASWSV